MHKVQQGNFKEALRLFYCGPDSTKSGGQNLFGMVLLFTQCQRSFFQMDNSPYERRRETFSVDQSHHSEQKSNIFQYQRRIRRGSTTSAGQFSHFLVSLYLPGYLLVANVDEL